MSNSYTRTPEQARSAFKDAGPYEAIVVNNFDTRYMGGLVVELLKYGTAGRSRHRPLVPRTGRGR